MLLLQKTFIGVIMKLIKVNFQGQELEVTLDRYVVVKDICEAVGLDFTRQYRKLKSDPTYESKLLKVQTAGGVQEVFCIPLDKLNGWLFSINPNKTKPEVREKLIVYKQECFRVLYEHFNHKTSYDDKDIQAIIRGYKSQIAQKNKLIEELKQKLLPNKSLEERLEIAERIASEDAILRPWSAEEIKVVIIGLQHIKDDFWLPPHLKRMKSKNPSPPNETLKESYNKLVKEVKELRKKVNKIKQAL